MAIWKAKNEGKHRFFAWQLAQRKILIADQLLIRNWPCDPICYQVMETAEHMCLHCVFAQEVWMLMQTWSVGVVQVPDRTVEVKEHVNIFIKIRS
jgi:hypothetical protein